MTIDTRMLTTVAPGALVGLGLMIGGALIGSGVVNARVGDRTVQVRGLAEREVKADIAVLPLRFTRTGDDLGSVQAALDRDQAAVRRFLSEQGYAPAEIEAGRLEVTDQQAQQYNNNWQGPRFILASTVSVRTQNVDRVQQTTRQLDQLVRQGIVLQNFNGASYIFTGLNAVRPAMIAEATKAARSGAEQFAKDSGASLAGIKSATQGSFEILPRDETPDGMGEASAVNKRVRVVTTVSYRLR